MIFWYTFYLFILVRLYDVNTFQCFVSSNPADQHKATITSVSFNIRIVSSLSVMVTWTYFEAIKKLFIDSYF